MGVERHTGDPEGKGRRWPDSLGAQCGYKDESGSSNDQVLGVGLGNGAQGVSGRVRRSRHKLQQVARKVENLVPAGIVHTDSGP